MTPGKDPGRRARGGASGGIEPPLGGAGPAPPSAPAGHRWSCSLTTREGSRACAPRRRGSWRGGGLAGSPRCCGPGRRPEAAAGERCRAVSVPWRRTIRRRRERDRPVSPRRRRGALSARCAFIADGSAGVMTGAAAAPCSWLNSAFHAAYRSGRSSPTPRAGRSSMVNVADDPKTSPGSRITRPRPDALTVHDRDVLLFPAVPSASDGDATCRTGRWWFASSGARPTGPMHSAGSTDRATSSEGLSGTAASATDSSRAPKPARQARGVLAARSPDDAIHD